MRLTSLLFVFSLPVVAQPVYTWTDAEGTHYTNDPQSIPKAVKSKARPLDERSLPEPALETAPPRARKTVPVAEEAPSPSLSVDESESNDAEPAEPVLTEADQAVLNRIDRTHSRANTDDEHNKDNAESFVRLIVHRDPRVVVAALKAATTLCSPNPGAGATFNGKPYERVTCSAAYYRAVVSQLDHADWRVRMAAASSAGWGAWGPHPDEPTIRALSARLTDESRTDIIALLISALWECHQGRQELVDAALVGLASTDDTLRRAALGSMTRTGQSGRLFSKAQRKRMERDVRPLLQVENHEVRAAALSALAAVGDHDFAVTTALSLADDPDVTLRVTAIQALGVLEDRRGLKKIVAALDDVGSLWVDGQGRARPGSPRVCDVALGALVTVSTAVYGPTGGYAPRKVPVPPEEMTAELARARAWANTHH